MDKYTQTIREFVVSNFLFGRDSGFADDASFLEQGIVDSTGVMELVAFLEKQFQIRIADEELSPENLDSVSAAAGFVAKKLGASA